MAFCGIWECFEKIDFFYFLVTQGTTLAHRLPQHRDLADHVTDVTNVTKFGHIFIFLHRVVDWGAETWGITVSRHAEFIFGGRIAWIDRWIPRPALTFDF